MLVRRELLESCCSLSAGGMTRGGSLRRGKQYSNLSCRKISIRVLAASGGIPRGRGGRSVKALSSVTRTVAALA